MLVVLDIEQVRCTAAVSYRGQVMHRAVVTVDDSQVKFSEISLYRVC